MEVFCELEAVPFVKKDTIPNTDTTQWDSFVFGNVRSNFEKQRIGLGEAKTDTAGKAYYQFTVPETLKAPSLLNGNSDSNRQRNRRQIRHRFSPSYDPSVLTLCWAPTNNDGGCKN